MAKKWHLMTRYGRTAFSMLLFQDIAAIPIIALMPLLGGAALGGSQVWIDGAIIAGVLLADSQFRHALEADIEPFKGLLLGLFFIDVGMSVNFGLLTTDFGTVIALVFGLVALKAAVLWGLGYFAGLAAEARRYLAISISQGGEFAFVILGIVVTAGALARETADLTILVVTISMAVTPLLYLAAERISFERPMEVLDEMPDDNEHPVIIAGFGRFGQIIGRMLRAKRIGFTALELDPNQVNFVAKVWQQGLLWGLNTLRCDVSGRGRGCQGPIACD